MLIQGALRGSAKSVYSGTLRNLGADTWRSHNKCFPGIRRRFADNQILPPEHLIDVVSSILHCETPSGPDCLGDQILKAQHSLGFTVRYCQRLTARRHKRQSGHHHRPAGAPHGMEVMSLRVYIDVALHMFAKTHLFRSGVTRR